MGWPHHKTGVIPGLISELAPLNPRTPPLDAPLPSTLEPSQCLGHPSTPSPAGDSAGEQKSWSRASRRRSVAAIDELLVCTMASSMAVQHGGEWPAARDGGGRKTERRGVRFHRYNCPE